MSDQDTIAATLAERMGCGPGKVHEGYGPQCASSAHVPVLFRDGRCEFAWDLAAVLAPLVAAARDEAQAPVAALTALPPWPTDGYQPYAVHVGDQVHLAVLLDDLRVFLDPDALTRHNQRVKAEALREAADDVQVQAKRGWTEEARRCARWLRDRADRAEGDRQDGAS